MIAILNSEIEELLNEDTDSFIYRKRITYDFRTVILANISNGILRKRTSFSCELERKNEYDNTIIFLLACKKSDTLMVGTFLSMDIPMYFPAINNDRYNTYHKVEVCTKWLEIMKHTSEYCLNLVISHCIRLKVDFELFLSRLCVINMKLFFLYCNDIGLNSYMYKASDNEIIKHLRKNNIEENKYADGMMYKYFSAGSAFRFVNY